ncbi:sensor histidine kinase [Bacillus sp. 3255]|uniref:sensor histidine kinase n=1 Tax=Bacillus sp. 3255 TaxID=2817904 RepID=UPI0028550B3D|nr:sensor histidine kinase [Bacillus sp. 3255]MDR6882568.1 signal transduction histidine kinase [Bacillus sp. 3255]
MVTRLRNKYVRGLLWVSYMYAAVFAVCTAADLLVHNELLRKEAYLHSKAFNDELALHWNLIRYTVENANYPSLKDDEKIGDKRMAAWQEQYAAMEQRGINRAQSLYEDRIAEAKNREKPEEVRQLEEQRDRQLAQIPLEIPKLMEIRKAEYLAYKNKEWNDVKASLAARSGGFQYYIRDKNAHRTYTNLSKEPSGADVTQALFGLKLPQADASSLLLSGINKYFQANGLEGYLLIPRTAPGFSQIHADYAYLNNIRDRLLVELGVLAVNLAVLGLLTWYFVRVQEFRIVREELSLTWIRRMPVDVRLLAAIFIMGIGLLQVGGNSFFQLPIRFGQFVEWTWLVITATLFILFVIDAMRMSAGKGEWHDQWSRSLVRRASALVGRRFISQSVLFKAGFVGGATVLLGGFLIMAFIGMAEIDSAPELLFFGLLYIVLYSATIVPYVYRRLVRFQRIITTAEQMASGHMTESIPEKGRGHLALLAGQLNNMKAGFKQLLDKEMRSERLKTELITNVSHDLKTPLTSIINYVDLLKQKDLTPETTERYVEVLDRKTQRLKVLIDDLFEASKMSSGAVELQVETVNVSSLLSQALAEFSDKIESSAAGFRIHIEHPQITAALDGRKTWRIFENLISNALKYAMPHTRVHLNLREEQENVIFTIKNVSAYELDFEAEELFERFKRGDQSRHTEGSGLGLSIAKSIAELQGGELHIEMDGDLFKVTVLFRKTKV